MMNPLIQRLLESYRQVLAVHCVEIWKVQRLLQRYKNLPSAQKERVAEAADTVGAASLLDLDWNNTIQHRAFKFHAASSR